MSKPKQTPARELNEKLMNMASKLSLRIRTHVENVIFHLCHKNELLPMEIDEFKKLRGMGDLTVEAVKDFGFYYDPCDFANQERNGVFLSGRAKNTLFNNNLYSVEETVDAIKSGYLTPFHKSNPKLRCYGLLTHFQICAWAGVPELAVKKI